MRRAAVICAAAAALALAAPAGAADVADRPDLVISLPGTPYSGQVAPVYVDAYEEPGRLLYRFDAVIGNQGGTLDLFKPPGGGVRQAIWAWGEPSIPPRPDQEPSGPDAQIEDRSLAGAGFEYAIEKTHEHWHFSSAARYELEPAGGTARVSDKVGFCMFDSFGPGEYFEYADQGPGGETWCRFGDDDPTQSVRMGLSPGASDRYGSQREFQWVDITGLEPGPATLRGRANPLLCILERDAANNTTEQSRVVPGVRVARAEAATAAGAPVGLTLRGEVVAPEVPARRDGACSPSADSTACYVFASAGTPLRFRVLDPPDHGKLALAPASGRELRATYTPAAGFGGEDRFTYVATDARGLTSPPATVLVTVAAPPAVALATAPAPAPVLASPVRLTRIRVVRRNGRWRVQLRASAAARLSGRLERRVRGRRTTRRLRARRVPAGPARMALGRLAPGRYRLRLFADGKPAGTAVFTVRARRRF